MNLIIQRHTESETMKIIGDKYDTEENILKLINKSTPTETNLTFKDFSEMAGWVHVGGHIDEKEFSIKYSSQVFDTAVFIQFFAELADLKDEITIFLDYEGSEPMLYAKKIDKDTIRFLFAHDYHLYDSDDADKDYLQLYKTEFDILVSKKELLGKFYIILYPYLTNYDENYAEFLGFHLKQAKKYMSIIKSYINKNMTSEEKKIIEETIQENAKEELGEWTKEMIKPENIAGTFDSTEEMMKSLWDEDD